MWQNKEKKEKEMKGGGGTCIYLEYIYTCIYWQNVGKGKCDWDVLNLSIKYV